MNTSYFANLKNIKNPVSISRYPPKWYTGPQYKLLAPSDQILKACKLNQITDEEYTKRFNEEILKPLSAEKVHKDLVSKFGEDVALLCFEKPGDFCHRRLVADWFKAELDLEVSELPAAAFYNALKKR